MYLPHPWEYAAVISMVHRCVSRGVTIPGAYKILNGQNILTGRSGRTSVKNINTLSRSFQIVVQSSQELDSREESVVDTLYNGLLSSNRACLAKSITLTESTHPRK